MVGTLPRSLRATRGGYEDPDAHKNVYGIPGEIGDNLFGRVVPEPIAEEQIMEGFLFAAEGELSVGDNVTQEVAGIEGKDGAEDGDPERVSGKFRVV